MSYDPTRHLDRMDAAMNVIGPVIGVLLVVLMVVAMRSDWKRGRRK